MHHAGNLAEKEEEKMIDHAWMCQQMTFEYSEIHICEREIDLIIHIAI